MPISLFLALKYLRPRRTYFSVVTIISIVGVSLGVAVLLIVLSVMSGFDEMWRERILAFNAHVTVSARGGIHDVDNLSAAINEIEGVSGVAPFIQGPVVVRRGERILTPMLYGIDPEREREVSGIGDHMRQGTFDIVWNEALVGVDFAAHAGIRPGDTLLVNSPAHFMTPDEIHLPEELELAGIFEVGMWEFDRNILICTLPMARELFQIEGEAEALKVMTEQPLHAHRIADVIQRELGPAYQVTPWMEQHQQLFTALRIEKNMMFFLLIFISIVAAFGITNTLITIAVQKTAEIGLLKAIGFSSTRVMSIFLWLGFIEGAAGAVLGLGLGLTSLHFRNDLLRWLSRVFNLEIFPKELYLLSEIPARTMPGDVLIVMLLVVVICTLAGLVPARRAARLDPVNALRYE